MFLGGSFKTLKKNNDGIVNIEFSLPFNAINSSQIIVKTPKLKMNARKSVHKGVILLKSPITGIRKVSRIRVGSVTGSETNLLKLPKIEERKSDNQSCENFNKSEVSSVREAIINFDSEIKKLRIGMKESQKSNGKSNDSKASSRRGSFTKMAARANKLASFDQNVDTEDKESQQLDASRSYEVINIEEIDSSSPVK